MKKLSKKKVIKELNEEIIELKNENKRLNHRIDTLNTLNNVLQAEFYKLQTEFISSSKINMGLEHKQVSNIKKIFCNEKKKATTVFFADNTTYIVKCAKGVKYDKYTAVAYAIVEKLFKSNSKFKRAVDKLEGK